MSYTLVRYRSSDLNAGHFKVNLISDPGCVCRWFRFGLWCLMPFSTIFQLYRGICGWVIEDVIVFL